MKEIELYLPIKTFLEKDGYIVKGEIHEIDIFGMKDGKTIAVELKTGVSLKLIYQGVERQKIADIVYLAIPLSAKKAHSDNYRHFLALLRRLQLGLMVVNNNEVKIELEPVQNEKATRTSKKKKAVIKEMTLRENDLNEGGTKGKKMTYYKEKALKIASFLIDYPLSSPKQIKEATQVSDVSSILLKNYYQWFSHPEKGVYLVNEQYKNEIIELILQQIIYQK